MRLPTLHHRSAPAAVIFALALTASATGSAVASASIPGKDKVFASNLPSVAETAAVYPAHRGGSRDVYRLRDVNKRATECLSYDTAANAASGKYASYTDRDGDSPYFAGKPSPVVYVHKFAERAKAKRVYAEVTGAQRACEGTYSEPGFAWKTAVVSSREQGATSLAVRERVRQDVGTDHFISIYVREGRYLVEVRIQQADDKPRKGKALRLTDRTLDRL